MIAASDRKHIHLLLLLKQQQHHSPFLQKANAAQKNGKIIFDTSKMPTAIIDVYLFSTKFIEANPDGVKGFFKVIFKAMDFRKTNKQEALAIAGKHLQLTPNEVEEQLKGVRLIDLPTNLKMLSDPQSDIYLLKQMNTISEFLLEKKQIPRKLDIAKVV